MIKCKTRNEAYIYINPEKIVTIEEDYSDNNCSLVRVQDRSIPIYVAEDMDSLVKRIRTEETFGHIVMN